MITKEAIVIGGVVCSIDKPFRHKDIYDRLKSESVNDGDTIIHEGFIATEIRGRDDKEEFLFREGAMLFAKSGDKFQKILKTPN